MSSQFVSVSVSLSPSNPTNALLDEIHGPCRLERIKELIEVYNADPHVDKDHVLCWPALFGRLEVIQYLVEAVGMDIRTREDYVLCKGARKGHLKVVVYALMRMGYFNGTNEGEKDKYMPCLANALAEAAGENREEVVRYFVEELKVDVGKCGEEALYEAIREGHLKMVKYLIQADKRDRKAKEEKYEKGMRLAVQGDHVEMVRFLMEYDENGDDKEGLRGWSRKLKEKYEEFMHMAEVWGCWKVVRYFKAIQEAGGWDEWYEWDEWDEWEDEEEGEEDFDYKSDVNIR